MVKQVIRCKRGQRLLDLHDGSRVKIEIKCKNGKCGYKGECNRKVVLVAGGLESSFSSDYVPQHCPICGQRLFDATKDSCGVAEIKCHRCRNIVNILIGDVSKPAFAA